MENVGDTEEKGKVTCECTGCDTPHIPLECPNEPVWKIEIHPVDNCQKLSQLEGVACQVCVDSYYARAAKLVAWGHEGARPQSCQGCLRPVTRISHVILNVEKV